MDESTQNVEVRDEATQTLEDAATQTPPDCSLELEVATLANKFLHAAYWFLVLGTTFTSRGLAGLARAARRREASCLESGRSLLGRLGQPKLADILRPDWGPGESSERAVRLMEQLDGWLEAGAAALEGRPGPGRLARLLDRILGEQRAFHADSRAMASRVLLTY
jgi:hypothetical protein